MLARKKDWEGDSGRVCVSVCVCDWDREGGQVEGKQYKQEDVCTQSIVAGS